EDAVLAMAPTSSTWVAATRLDVGKLISDVRAGAAGVHPEAAKQGDEAAAQINSVLGLDVQKDLLGPLGDQWMPFNSADAGRGGNMGGARGARGIRFWRTRIFRG